MFHMGGFAETLDAAGAFANLTALQDDRLFSQGDDLRVPSMNEVILLAGGADSTVASRIRLDSPTLDELVRFEIAPHNTTSGDAEPGTPHVITDLRENPLHLGEDELLQCQVLSNGAATLHWALLWFSDGPVRPISGQRMFTARLTGTATLVVDVFTDVVLILDENLPPGTYQIVGARFESAGCVAGRVVIRTRDQARPGALGTDLVSDLDSPIFRYGKLGIWGEFPFTQLPAAEFLSAVADTAEIVHLDLIRISR